MGLLSKTKYSLLGTCALLFRGAFYVFVFLSCSIETSKSAMEVPLVSPVDSFSFSYSNNTLRQSEKIKFGMNVIASSDSSFLISGITKSKYFYLYNSADSTHTYSEFPFIKNKDILAFNLNNRYLHLLTSNNLYIFKYDSAWVPVDSFNYLAPSLPFEHGIDFEDSKKNLYQIEDYFVVLYFGVLNNDEYRNTPRMFYYFNSDTAFFAVKECEDLEDSYVYFRYPAMYSNTEYLFHAPQLRNCISQSRFDTIYTHIPIADDNSVGYFEMKKENIYILSKFKQDFFKSDLNVAILGLEGNGICLIRRVTDRLYQDDLNRTRYEHSYQLIHRDSAMNVIRKYAIASQYYSTIFYQKKSKLYFIHPKKEMVYVFKN